VLVKGLRGRSEELQPIGRAAVGPGLGLLVLLTLLVAVGLHVKLTPPLWSSHSKLYDMKAAGALEAVFIVLLLGLAVRSRRAPASEFVAAGLRAALWWVLALGAVSLAAVLLALANVALPAIKPRQAAPSPSIGRPPPLHGLRATSGGGSAFHVPGSDVLYALIAAILVLAVVAAALITMRQGRRQIAPEPGPPAQDYTRTVQDAVLGGRRALLQLDDAKAAIIACYSAMEESLAQAGAARSSAETPDELLAKAAGMLLVSAGAAACLTSLFYEARFSSHHMGDSQKDAAEKALAELEAGLRQRRPAVPAGTG
jgi:hypothetical protein